MNEGSVQMRKACHFGACRNVRACFIKRQRTVIGVVVGRIDPAPPYARETKKKRAGGEEVKEDEGGGGL